MKIIRGVKYMWDRSQLKQNAKKVLDKSYWQALLASVVLGIAVNSSSGFSLSVNAGSLKHQLDGMDPFISTAVISILSVALIFAFIFSSVFSILVAGPLEVGAQRYFLESTQFRFNIKEIGYGFTCGKYKNVVIVMLIRNIFTFLWTLLLVIPGIVKMYAYSMVPFILAENPSISATQALDISCRMTARNKWDIFTLDLSFIGWYILGFLAFFIGTIFVSPYYNSTKAQLYLALRSAAIDNGTVSLNELEGSFK